MQDLFCSSRTFLQRTDFLASKMGVLLRDLPAITEISARAMYGYRSGKYPVTAKALRKLRAAEAAAGITDAEDKIAKSEGNTKDLMALLAPGGLTTEQRLARLETLFVSMAGLIMAALQERENDDDE